MVLVANFIMMNINPSFLFQIEAEKKEVNY